MDLWIASKDTIRLYTTSWCGDCRSAKEFLRARGIAYEEIDIDEDLDAEEIVLRVNDGRRKVPTIQYGDRYFACSPFDPKQLATELNLPPNGQR
jgi:mycoredoxin